MKVYLTLAREFLWSLFENIFAATIESKRKILFKVFLFTSRPTKANLCFDDFFLCFEVWGFSYLHFFYWLWLLSCLNWTVKFLMVSNRSLTNIYLTASRKEIKNSFCNLFPINHCNSYKLTEGTLSWNIINQNKMFYTNL